MRGQSIWARAFNRSQDERGSVAIEAAIGVPAFGLFIAMIILGGRVEIAKQSVEAAAYEAARAASIERTQSEAISSGKSAANSSLNDQGLQCATTNVTVNAAGFNAPLGTTAQVTATVTCKVDVADLAIPGLPGTRTITATASSPVDAYRERR
ncbi:TadE/TadG family type IV pilus assembly protein [Nocardioides sp.]|uniref:TadE/TadG family type IV pilus assembly protein n=1 Tax=Nocardioides sp. TaxID=35761 RepID=UPI002616A661|nr:TadE/TadG family type IV pilus assembly protein [Nocardioides sp.]